MVTLLASHAAGCTPIVITDLQASRLEVAKKLIPTVKTVQIERSWTSKETSEAIKEAAGTGIRVAIDATGFESSITAAIYVRVTPLSMAIRFANIVPVCCVWRKSLRHWCRSF